MVSEGAERESEEEGVEEVMVERTDSKIGKVRSNISSSAACSLGFHHEIESNCTIRRWETASFQFLNYLSYSNLAAASTPALALGSL